VRGSRRRFRFSTPRTSITGRLRDRPRP
jgi:hypothetical protein